ncbi:hypothetical protein [Streptomyces orinoci]|uniref:Uncharacterized protein n=1 Tax=Streptomyces orinoci TaxID=67339 RepID=A0ABV3K1J4_STRON|nr:hypothetical protein [Streptomyces orinoci]
MTRHRDNTRNLTEYRITALWPGLTTNVGFRHADRRHVYAKARKWAAAGALVVVERSKGYE